MFSVLLHNGTKRDEKETVGISKEELSDTTRVRNLCSNSGRDTERKEIAQLNTIVKYITIF